MHDVIIKNMEMPESCFECVLTNSFFRNLHCAELEGMGNFVGLPHENDRHPDCPLVILSKGHGKLIDADALDRAFTDLRFNSDGTLNHWGDRPGWCMHGYEVEKLIADAHTIVPAEGGTDECSEN